VTNVNRTVQTAPALPIRRLARSIVAAWVAAFIILAATAGQAETTTVYRPASPPAASNPFVPCDHLPAAAVKSIPPPFDRYMQFQCHIALGQGLRSVDGFHWANRRGYGTVLSSTSTAVTTDANGLKHFKFSWYTKLTPVTLSAPEIGALRTSLKNAIETLPRFLDEAAIDTAAYLELKALTSNGEDKRILLVVPDTKPGFPVWLAGFECNGVCFRDDPEPMGFAGRPN
jgi:hypothetical protein